MRDRGKSRTVLLLLLVSTALVPILPVHFVWAPLQPHGPIMIQSNADFTAANGVLTGSGSATNPYVIQGWNITVNSVQTGISIKNTNAYFTVRNVTIEAAAGAQSTFGISISSASNGMLTANRILNTTWGLEFSYSNHFSISKTNITNTQLDSIGIMQSSWLNITSNNIVKSTPGIRLEQGDHVLIVNNTISSTNGAGISASQPFGSTYLTITKNSFIQSSGLLLQGVSLNDYDSHTISSDNTVNGLPLYYYKDCNNLNLDNVPIGQLIVVNCKNTLLSTLRINGVAAGLEMAYDNGAVVKNTDLSNNGYGLFLTSSSNVTVSTSTFSNDQTGLQVDNTTAAKLNTNTFSNDGVTVTGTLLQDFDTHTITTDNLVNGKPIYYYHDIPNILLSSTPVGQVILANTVNTVLSSLQISATETGILVAFVDRTRIIQNNITSNHVGISIITSTNVNVTGNSLSYDGQGISLTGYSSILNSTVPDGIVVANNSLSNIKNYAITVGASHNTTVTANRATNSEAGLFIELAYGTLVTNNTFIQNGLGAVLSWTNHCRIYHNTFILNGFQGSELSPVPSSWDNGYPGGGNFWSDYFGPDLHHGPYQNITGSDGIGDVPYNVTASARDRYPVAAQYILSINSVAGGSTNPVWNISYPFGWTITVSETPWNQFVFDHWQLDGSSLGSSTTLNILATAPSAKHYLVPVFNWVPSPFWPPSSSLTASGIVQTALVLTWIPSGGIAASYKIYNGGVLIATVSEQTTSYVVTGLTPGTSYNFKVEACDSAGTCTTNGPTASATTTTTIPNQPTQQPTFPPSFVLLALAIAAIMVIPLVALFLAKSRAKKHSEPRFHPEDLREGDA